MDWARWNRSYVAGEAALAGIDVDQVDARTYLDVAYALLIRSGVGPKASPAMVMQAIDEHVRETHIVDVETWGESDEAAAGQAALSALIATQPAPDA